MKEVKVGWKKEVLAKIPQISRIPEFLTHGWIYT